MHVAIALAVLLGFQGDEPSKTAAKTTGETVQPDPGWKSLGRSLWFDPKEGRLVPSPHEGRASRRGTRAPHVHEGH